MPEPIITRENPPRSILRKGRTVGIVGVITVCVAVFGYVREATLAARFGTSATMDAYFAAIFIPNILYLVLIAGTLSPVFIPILMQENPDENPDKASLTFSVVTNFALLVLIVLVCCGLLGASRWMPLLFPGFAPPTVRLALRLVYVIFPALPFLAVAGILTALLNGFHRFRLAAFAPAFASIAVVLVALLARGDRAIYAVGIATAAGFVLQCLVLLPAAASVGIRYRPVMNFRHPAIAKLLRLGIPLFLYLAVANASLMIERNLASRISAGAVSILTYALRLFTVPSNFLAAPLAIVAYPGFAREAVREERGELANQVSRLFRLIVFLFLPVTVWIILNAPGVTRLVYEHGRFLAADSRITSRILAIYGAGIFPNAIAIVLLRGFFAIEDTLTPLLAELVDLAFFVLVAPYFTHRFGIEGLATARAMTFFLVTAILMFVLGRRHLLKFDDGFFRFLWRTAAATAVMGLVTWISLSCLRRVFDPTNVGLQFLAIVMVLFLSGGSFFLAARLLGLGQARQIVNTVLDLLSGRRDRSV